MQKQLRSRRTAAKKNRSLWSRLGFGPTGQPIHGQRFSDPQYH